MVVRSIFDVDVTDVRISDQTPDLGGSRIKIVTIGGGTGLSVLLRGLKRYVDCVDITAVVTTFDDGGSSGALRAEFGVPALGDLRRCIAALLPETQSGSMVEQMIEHRFNSDGPLKDHSLGNLILLGIWQRSEGLSEAITELSESLGLLGRVLPVSNYPSDLCGELRDGTVICGESAIGERNQELFDKSEIYLNPPVTANPSALQAIAASDIVILGPGDLFTSVIPNLLPDGVVTALQKSSARILQICNIETKSDETAGYVASDFVVAINRHLNRTGDNGIPNRSVDAIIVNEFDNVPSGSGQRVPLDERVYDSVQSVIVRSVASTTKPRNHAPAKLAASVMEYVHLLVSDCC